MAPSPLSSPQLKDQITQRVFIHELPAAIAKSEWETDSLFGVNSSCDCDCVHACAHAPILSQRSVLAVWSLLDLTFGPFKLFVRNITLLFLNLEFS